MFHLKRQHQTGAGFIRTSEVIFNIYISPGETINTESLRIALVNDPQKEIESFAKRKAKLYGPRNSKRPAVFCTWYFYELNVTYDDVKTNLDIMEARPAFTYLLNVDRSIVGLTLVYFRWYCLGLIFQFGYNIFSSILRAVGDSAATLYFLLISSVLNIGLDVLFVAVFKWGVAGAAVATDLSQMASFIAAYYYMTKKYPAFRFRLRDYEWDIERIGSTKQKTLRYGCALARKVYVA